jgi:hypothetical protein
MAGARPHRRRRAAASEEVSCLGEQRERSIVPALMWPGRRFRPSLAAAASQGVEGRGVLVSPTGEQVEE